MPCLRLLRLETALPSGVFTPPMPVRSVFKRLFARSGLLGRFARGCLAFGVLVAGGVGVSGVAETGTSVGCASLDCASAPGECGLLDSGMASGVQGASGTSEG